MYIHELGGMRRNTVAQKNSPLPGKEAKYWYWQILDSGAFAWLGRRSMSDGLETSVPRQYESLPYS